MHTSGTPMSTTAADSTTRRSFVSISLPSNGRAMVVANSMMVR
ncbi:hypothetical protein [Eggerthella sinensis]|nr:hypothetical protein [Eggerthella sinensis]